MNAPTERLVGVQLAAVGGVVRALERKVLRDVRLQRRGQTLQ